MGTLPPLLKREGKSPMLLSTSLTASTAVMFNLARPPASYRQAIPFPGYARAEVALCNPF